MLVCVVVLVLMSELVSELLLVSLLLDGNKCKTEGALLLLLSIVDCADKLSGPL